MTLSAKFAARRPGEKTAVPGPKSVQFWSEDQKTMGPGLQAVVQWAQLAFERGEGPFLQDVDGNVYIDFMGGSGVNSIGHSHPKYVEAMSRQLSQVMIGGFVSKARLEMMDCFRKILPPHLDQVQLYSGGTEAVEAALRLAKSYTKKFEFLSFWNGYHGKSLGALALTDGAKKGFGPMAPGAMAAPYADCYRCPFKLRFPSCQFECVKHVREVIRHESTGSLAAIIVEPIQGRMGNVTPPPGYLRELQKVAHDAGALLIVDETMTCIGRTGKMFAFNYDDVKPDIIILGKGLGAGFPVTAIASTSEIMSVAPFSEPSASSSSFGAFPLACEAVKSTLQAVVEEGLSDHAARVGGELLEMMQVMQREIPIVGEVRGRGLMMGIELVDDKKTLKPASKETLRKVFVSLLEQGVLVMMGGHSIRLYPALNIDPEVARTGIRIIDRVLRELSKELNIQ